MSEQIGSVLADDFALQGQAGQAKQLARLFQAQKSCLQVVCGVKEDKKTWGGYHVERERLYGEAKLEFNRCFLVLSCFLQFCLGKGSWNGRVRRRLPNL